MKKIPVDLEIAMFEATLELFGKGAGSRVSKLDDLFTDFMARRKIHRPSYNQLLGATDFVFDSQLPEPGVVTMRIYKCGFNHACWFLECLKQGAETGLASAEEDADELGRCPVDPELASRAVEFDRHDELEHAGYVRDALIFLWDKYHSGWNSAALEGADSICFKDAWRFLQKVASFRTLLTLVGLPYGRGVGRDNPKGAPVAMDYFDAALVRVDLRRCVVYAPRYSEAEPWVAKIEDIVIFNKLAHPGMAEGWGEERAQETPVKVVPIPAQREAEEKQQLPPNTQGRKKEQPSLGSEEGREFLRTFVHKVLPYLEKGIDTSAPKIVEALGKHFPKHFEPGVNWSKSTMLKRVNEERPTIRGEMSCAGDAGHQKSAQIRTHHIEPSD